MRRLGGKNRQPHIKLCTCTDTLCAFILLCKHWKLFVLSLQITERGSFNETYKQPPTNNCFKQLVGLVFDSLATKVKHTARKGVHATVPYAWPSS